MTSKVVEQAREAFLEELDIATEQVLDNWREHVDTVGIEITKGGSGSGHRGHAGRPGKVGGSAPGIGGGRTSSQNDDEKALMKYLDTVSAMRESSKPKRFKYAGVEELVLKHGQFFDPPKPSDKLPKGCKRGKAKECFYNTTMALTGTEGLTYVEGYATTDVLSGFGFQHAWLVDKEDNVIDLTWKPGHGTAYFGVKMSRDFVMKTTLRTEMVGIIVNDWMDGHRLMKNGFPKDALSESRTKHNDTKTVEKQLPISHESKQALIELRTRMFYDISDNLAEQVYTGDISIGQWQESMKQAIREVHSSNAAIGKGGWDLMEPADWGRLGPQMQNQYRYLQGFAEHVSENRETISMKHIKARARLYGEGAAGSAVLMEAGVVFEALLPYMPKDGSTKCLNRCHCQWLHNITGTDGDFRIVDSTWVLGIADHCETCLERDGHVETNRVHKVVDIPVSIGGY